MAKKHKQFFKTIIQMGFKFYGWIASFVSIVKKKSEYNRFDKTKFS